MALNKVSLKYIYTQFLSKLNLQIARTATKWTVTVRCLHRGLPYMVTLD